MSPEIINNPEAVHKYRGEILSVIERLNNQLKSTENAFDTANLGWKDITYQEVRNNFNADKEQIASLCKILKIYESDILAQMERKLRIYLGSRTQL